MFLNRLNKLIFMFIALFAVVLIDSSEVLALECTSSDKYACAKCVYTSDIDGSIVYTIKSDGTSNLQFSTKFYDTAGNERTDSGAKIGLSDVTKNTFVAGSEANESLKCLPKIYVGYNNGFNISYDQDVNHGTAWYLSNEQSTNNNKKILSDTAPAIRKSCDFPVYVGELDDRDKIQQKYAKVSTDGESLYVDFVVSNYYLSSGAEQKAREKSLIKNLLLYEDKNNQCPCFAISCNAVDGGEKYVCTLTTQVNSGNCSDSKPTEKVNSQFECKYTGMIDNQTLTVFHYENKYGVIYPGTTEEVEITKSNKGGNVFTDSCDDIFYSAKNKTIKSVDADSKYASSYVTQFCRTSSDTEQYCHEGNCAIANAICGTSETSENIDGNCPTILKYPILFLKRVVFNTLQIFVPIFLILMGTIDFARSVMSSDEKNMREYIGKFIKRVLTAIAFFFITTIVSIVIGMFANTDVGSKDSWKACWQNID